MGKLARTNFIVGKILELKKNFNLKLRTSERF